jgi:hypothetical protein
VYRAAAAIMITDGSCLVLLQPTAHYCRSVETQTRCQCGTSSRSAVLKKQHVVYCRAGMYKDLSQEYFGEGTYLWSLRHRQTKFNEAPGHGGKVGLGVMLPRRSAMHDRPSAPATVICGLTSCAPLPLVSHNIRSRTERSALPGGKPSHLHNHTTAH